jgi:acetyl esterase/lipase
MTQAFHRSVFFFAAITFSLLLKFSPLFSYLRPATIMTQIQTISELSPADSAKQSPKFERFNITTTPYKVVNGQEIPVHVFIPKDLSTDKPPVLVRFHGGFLITGAALFPDFTAIWALDYCIQHNAIWVAPDYRLLPESNGLEIMSDLSDFWTWLHKDLKGYLRSLGTSITPNLNKVMAYGESAGGYLAVQSALTQPDLVKAVIAAFPMLECDAPWYSEKAPGKSPFGAPEVSKTFLDKHMADLPKGTIATAGYPPARIPLALVSIQQGIFSEMLGSDDSLYPLRVLEKTRADETLPFLFIFHGTDDRAVPWDGTKKFANMWREKFGEESIHSHFASGDHGYGDQDALNSDWLQKGLAGVTKAWL